MINYLIRKCMKRTMLRKSMDKPQPTWVMIVRLFRSVLEMVVFGGACTETNKNTVSTQSESIKH